MCGGGVLSLRAYACFSMRLFRRYLISVIGFRSNGVRFNVVVVVFWSEIRQNSNISRNVWNNRSVNVIFSCSKIVRMNFWTKRKRTVHCIGRCHRTTGFRRLYSKLHYNRQFYFYGSPRESPHRNWIRFLTTGRFFFFNSLIF